jgi:drug/metabolite transporter (DMT)-like permease
MNGGIVGALIAINTVFVMISAYLMFGERLTKIKFLCMLLLMSSVVLVVLFPPDQIFNQDDLFVQTAGVGGVDTTITDTGFWPKLT